MALYVKTYVDRQHAHEKIITIRLAFGVSPITRFHIQIQ